LWLVLWTILPLSIWLSDRGPVFYTQVRAGKNGRPFKIIKFRTMIMNAEQTTGPVWATDDDPRVTRVGRLLRRLRLDELPQVVNILKGEMSLVGPRPERPELVDEFSRDVPHFATRHLVRPGFAGLAQVRGRYSTTPRNKLRYDHLYIRTLNPLLDVKLMVLAVLVVLRGSPAETKSD
jgi:lipopolysaccharide/colanic/teichoic acid biosynthesis glycosyltransferase